MVPVQRASPITPISWCLWLYHLSHLPLKSCFFNYSLCYRHSLRKSGKQKSPTDFLSTGLVLRFEQRLAMLGSSQEHFKIHILPELCNISFVLGNIKAVWRWSGSYHLHLNLSWKNPSITSESPSLHRGHFGLWSRHLSRHLRQKVCPQGVVTGS